MLEDAVGSDSHTHTLFDRLLRRPNSGDGSEYEAADSTLGYATKPL
jgi:hypothetical protein